MTFLADECCDALLVDGLRQDGHDVLYVLESMAGADDATVLSTAASQRRVLLTEDKDFGMLVVRLALPAYGVVLIRIDPADSPAKLARIRELLRDHPARLAGMFVVVQKDRFRFRPLTPPAVP